MSIAAQNGMMRAGKLRHIVFIQAASGTKDASGHIDKTEDSSDWASPGTEMRAEVKPLTGDEAEEARRLAPTATHRVTVRYQDGINSTQNRVEFGSRHFAVRSALNTDERSRELVLLCEEQL